MLRYDATMYDLFLEHAIEPLGDADGLGLGDAGVRDGWMPQNNDLVH